LFVLQEELDPYAQGALELEQQMRIQTINEQQDKLEVLINILTYVTKNDTNVSEKRLIPYVRDELELHKSGSQDQNLPEVDKVCFPLFLVLNSSTNL